MGMITKISFRNLIRQKRRNILLGTGIALSMCLFIVSCSFVNGISDNLLNNVIVYMTGHISITAQEKMGDSTVDIIRDKDKLIQFAMENIEGINEVWEDVNTLARCLGNGKATTMALVGMWEDEGLKDYFDVITGNINDIFLTDERYTPILIYNTTAEDLNVELNDIIKAKITNIYGVIDNRNFKVAAIAKADNVFMSFASFVEINALKEFMGYKEYETGTIDIILEKVENPYSVIQKADLFHELLLPESAGINASFSINDSTASGNLFGLKLNEENQSIIMQTFSLTPEQYNEFSNNERSILINEQMARDLNINSGERIYFEYKTKFTEGSFSDYLIVKGIFTANSDKNGLENNIVFAHEDVFNKHYFSNLPEQTAVFNIEHELFPVLVKEWEILERSENSDESRIKHQKLNRTDWNGTILDIQTMYEFPMADGVLKLAGALNIISFIAVFILFSIILIGVINSIRMSIRERTREIGTNRAIGMLKGDVKAVFVFEVLFLTVFACIAGIILAFILMGALGSIVFDVEDNPISMLLINDQIYFFPTAFSIFISFILILLIALVIAYFPSGKAAKMKIADALRHYE